MPYFLGIDNGGTVTKAALFDERGGEIASASRETPLLTPRAGYNERDMTVLWETNIACIREVLRRFGKSSSEIAGIGCTGHGKGLYLWGRDGRPAYNGIASTDRRAEEIVARWNADGTAAAAAEKTLQPVISCQPVALLRWLEENDTDVLGRTKWIFECKDYIRFMLTGVAAAEETDYSGTCLMNLTTRSFDRGLTDGFGISRAYECLPPLCCSYESCGGVSAEAARLTGLAEGTPVCGGMFDIDACAVATDATRPKQLCVVTGTWSINEYVSVTPVGADATTRNSLFCLPGTYLVEESSPTSAGNLEWYLKTCMGAERAKAEGKNIYKEADEAVQALPPQATDMIFLPFLYGTNTACENAAFIGLSNSHGTANMLRAIFEGVAFSHRMHIERLLRFRETPEAVRMAGGAANSRVWVQMFADALNIPVEVVTTRELGAKGCAMAAAVAAGAYKDLSTAAAAMVPAAQTVMPDPTLTEIYNKKYARYVRLTELLEGF